MFTQKSHFPSGSFILHLLLGLCWDEAWNCWDRSQLSPSKTPTIHPSGFLWNILISVPKRKATISKFIPTESQQRFWFCFVILVSLHFWKVMGYFVGIYGWMWNVPMFQCIVSTNNHQGWQGIPNNHPLTWFLVTLCTVYGVCKGEKC